MPLLEALLATMIQLAPPGQSPYSVVALAACGDNPLKAACADVKPAPNWSPLYKAFVRQENKAEGLERYLLIARAIEAVANESAQSKEADGTVTAAIWPWAAEDLARALTTIAFHESAFRRDVHSGVGKSALGDCGYWNGRGQRMTDEEGRAHGGQYMCRSVCLIQINTGGLTGKRYGFTGQELVGTDKASTEKCFRAGAQAFSNARNRCAATKTDDWFKKTIASYGTGKACETDEAWVGARVTTFEKLRKTKDADLAEDVKKLLGLAKVDGAKVDAPKPAP